MTVQHAVRVYGPGVPDIGVKATLLIDDTTARISQFGLSLPLAAIRLRPVGFSSRGLEIAWQDQSGTWALQVLEPDGARALLAELRRVAPNACAEFALQCARLARNGRARWMALGLLLLVPVIAVAGFLALLDPITNWAISHVSREQERRLGEESFRSMVAQLRLRDSSDGAQVVRSLGQKLTQTSRYRYEFHLADDRAVNAFALPGGIVVVNTGLVEATRRPEELAGVLAHEAEHVELRHSLQQIAKQLGLSAIVALFMGDIGATLGGRVAEQLLRLKFTRAAEQQADQEAVSLLVRVGIDPTGLRDFFGRLAGEPAPPSILSSHPASAERQGALAKIIRMQASSQFAPLDYGAWPPPVDGVGR